MNFTFILITLATVMLAMLGMGIYLYLLMRKLEQKINAHECQLSLLPGYKVSIQKRIDQLEKSIPKFELEIENLQQETKIRNLQGSGDTHPYSMGIRMAQSGSGKKELMADCGLTGAEAELILILHGKQVSGGHKNHQPANYGSI